MSDELIAVFADPDAASHALTALAGEGVTGARIASPAAFPAVEETGRPGPWRVLGWVALVAGLTGLACAMALEVVTSKSMGSRWRRMSRTQPPTNRAWWPCCRSVAQTELAKAREVTA